MTTTAATGDGAPTPPPSPRPSRARASRALTPDQLTEVIGLLKGADSAELKLSVPDADRRSAVAELGMDPLDAQIRQVFFLDTPELTLNKAGVVVRTRRVQRKVGDAIVKLRPIDPATVSPKIRKLPAFGVEVDAMPGGFVCSGTMKTEVDNAIVKETVRGGQPLSKLFTKDQRALYAEQAPEGIELNALSVLGPITVLKLKFVPADFDRRLVAELWFYPDGKRILELSTKCLPTEAFDVAAQMKSYLSGKGINLEAQQQTKTATALRFFAKELLGNRR